MQDWTATTIWTVRNEHHVTDQATFRIDHVFSARDNLSVRYSFSSRKRLHAPKPAGFRSTSRQFLATWKHFKWSRVINSRTVNIAAIGVSRLSMHRSSENSDDNDIVFRNWEFRELASEGKVRLARHGSTSRAIREWAIRLQPRQCMPGTRYWKLGMC